MPPRRPTTPRDKREELKTYRELTLDRSLKSARQRRRLEADGLRRVLGNGTDLQPYLVVDAARYRSARLENQHRLLLHARQEKLDLPVDLLLDRLNPRIEALTYAQLAAEREREILHNLPVAALGRSLTTEEKTHFAASHAASETAPASRPPSSRAALNQVLGRIEKRQAHNPARYQTLWAQVVGADAAQQSHLEKIDPATQIAWFRCINSVLSADLQRRTGLAAKLGKALGLPIRQLRAKF